jgi:chromosome segregation ATPase
MAISWVQQGYIQVAGELTYNPDSFDGVKLESPRGLAWLESISSFRFEPTGDGKPYTVRKEASGYWYGYKRVSGKLHKKYIGKSSEISVAKLEEIAEALNIPPQPRVTDKVTQVADVVTQVTEASNQQVTDAVTDSHTVERVTALESQMQALRESLEALRSELLGKPEGLGNFSELPNPCEVTDSELQIELGNLKTELSNLATENEKLRADYDTLLESSTVVTNKLRQEVQELRSQLETEKTDREEVEAELAEVKQKSAATSELPEAADLLNQLKKAKGKKSTASLADVEFILEILEES